VTLGTRTKVRITTCVPLLEFLQMAAWKSLCGVWVLAASFASIGAQAADKYVHRVTVIAQDPFQLQIQTNSAAAPQTQLISGPDRLVIDIPNTLPAASLRGVVVNRGEVKGVRVGLFSASPPVTRIVVDLTAPHQYHIVPTPTGFLVSLGTNAANDNPSATNAPTIGWVSAKSSVRVVSAPPAPPAKKNALHTAMLGPNSVNVEFAHGLLSIHATGATLSQVLFEIQKKTGAEIAIPSGTEQDRVAADFGPGPASEVLGELLNGSGLNFVVVGSEADPTALRSVILSRASEASSAPSGVPQRYTPPAAENIPPENQEAITPADETITPPDNANPPQPGQPPVEGASPAPPPSQ